MRPLIIGPDEQAAIAKVVAYAMEPDHFYSAGRSSVPGEDSNFVAHVPMGFRCVFTFTKHEGKLFRHLTVSVPDKDRRPSPEAMIVLAKEFGFTVSDDSFDLAARIERDGWLISMGHEDESCIVAAQPIEPGGVHDRAGEKGQARKV